MKKFAEHYFRELDAALKGISRDKIAQAIAWFKETRDLGKRIYVCGNGGSASTASHFVCDLLKGASFNRSKKFRIVALTDSLPTITAYANDVGPDVVFVEQLKNLAEPGDLVMAISGSGNSPNVLKAIEYANSIGCKTLALTGKDGGKLGPMAGLNLQVTCPHMGRIEDAHLVLCHIIGYYFMEEKGAL